MMVNLCQRAHVIESRNANDSIVIIGTGHWFYSVPFWELGPAIAQEVERKNLR